MRRKPRVGRWFETHRLDWIVETLRVFGFINREHLERKFGISTPQASLDLSRFIETHPGVMAYDLSAKCYVAVTRTKQKQAKGKG